MAESSWPWTDGAGDGGPYAANTWDDDAEILLTTDQAATQGVVKGYLNELAVSGAASPVSVATGAAIVKGKRYKNTAAVDVSVPTPSGATRVDYIVLEADFTGQTVRIARVAGTEGAGAPSLTQVDGTTWQVPLATASITVGGVITVTDARSYVKFGTAVDAGMIDNRTRKFFVPVNGTYNTTDAVACVRQGTGGWLFPDLKDCTGWGDFELPPDWVSGLTIEALVCAENAGNIYSTAIAYYAADGEVQWQHQDVVVTAAVALGNGTLEYIQTITPTALAAGDHVAVKLTRYGTDANDTIGGYVFLLGWLVTYTADS